MDFKTKELNTLLDMDMKTRFPSLDNIQEVFHDHKNIINEVNALMMRKGQPKLKRSELNSYPVGVYDQDKLIKTLAYMVIKLDRRIADLEDR
ncbi:hypothetical protein [Psychrobacter sp. BI730]|uniref:hypothetical protein n=1 Tax=Psychrobacter sp. BI730 TaxID=2705463 RepID=UPI0015C77199|nr:hypothetical protein [Psychrobacter sp. BI730]NYR10873.1 hypothetical protein [Psychrobacter sp. BI730]